MGYIFIAYLLFTNNSKTIHSNLHVNLFKRKFLHYAIQKPKNLRSKPLTR